MIFSHSEFRNSPLSTVQYAIADISCQHCMPSPSPACCRPSADIQHRPMVSRRCNWKIEKKEKSELVSHLLIAATRTHSMKSLRIEWSVFVCHSCRTVLSISTIRFRPTVADTRPRHTVPLRSVDSSCRTNFRRPVPVSIGCCT